MDIFIEPIGRLINQFSKLPGVGKKTAQRYAYKIIGMSEGEAKEFAESIIYCKQLDIAGSAATLPKTKFAISAARAIKAPFASSRSRRT